MKISFRVFTKIGFVVLPLVQFFGLFSNKAYAAVEISAASSTNTMKFVILGGAAIAGVILVLLTVYLTSKKRPQTANPDNVVDFGPEEKTAEEKPADESIEVEKIEQSDPNINEQIERSETVEEKKVENASLSQNVSLPETEPRPSSGSFSGWDEILGIENEPNSPAQKMGGEENGVNIGDKQYSPQTEPSSSTAVQDRQPTPQLPTQSTGPIQAQPSGNQTDNN